MVLYQASLDTPPARGVYFISLLDVPGVVASNNFVSVMNPARSGIRHEGIEVRLGAYATASSSTPNSIAGYRITSHSGGSVYDPTTVGRQDTTMPNPVSEVRIGNPAVARLNNTALVFRTPPFSTGTGDSSLSNEATPPGLVTLAAQGEGFVLNTAAGNVNQVWDIFYIWSEYQL